MIARRQVPDPVREHLESLRTSDELTRWFRHAREPWVEKVSAEGVIAALHRAGINPVLMGTHGLVGYRSEPRATQDVDVLVTKKVASKGVAVLGQEYPYLEVNSGTAVTRMLDPVSKKVMIDVMKPTTRLMTLVFRHNIKIGSRHRIPALEMALACKFAAMRAPNRRQDKQLLDLADFIDVVHYNRATLDLGKLQRLADLAQPRGGTTILALIEDIDAGRRIRL